MPWNHHRPAVMAAGLVLVASIAVAASPGPPVAPRESKGSAAAAALGSHIVLSWNDLGMHCINNRHQYLSVLPPYNNLHAQVIRRGDATRLPQLLAAGTTVDYSIPGNTTSANKTDFWTYAPLLFGVTLPPDIGLTGRGLTGTFTLSGFQFIADGIPITPFTDAAPTVENPYQQALVIARDAGGAELARSRPVIPVSGEMGCVSSGCHASETAILNGHEREAGFDPANTPILCASCHADPALGTTGIEEAGTFSFRMHDQHKFLDEEMSGAALCYKCHPGNQAQCLRGQMSHKFGMVCQDCHGGMIEVSQSIEQGRIPWVEEPACRTCHTARFGEPVGQLFRNSTGHGGVQCSGCHGSPHAEYASLIPADNANMVDLQGHSGVLTDCSVCHGIVPTGQGPHDITMSGVEEELVGHRPPLSVSPNPVREACTIRMPRVATGPEATDARAFVFDAQGRTIRMLPCRAAGPGGIEATWDSRDASGARVRPGVYFIQVREGGRHAAAKVIVAR